MADAHAATISEVSRRDFISSKANSTPAAWVPQGGGKARHGPGHNIGASGQGMGSRRPPKRMKPRAHGPAHLDARPSRPRASPPNNASQLPKNFASNTRHHVKERRPASANSVCGIPEPLMSGSSLTMRLRITASATSTPNQIGTVHHTSRHSSSQSATRAAARSWDNRRSRPRTRRKAPSPGRAWPAWAGRTLRMWNESDWT